jgi:hypothetical protein
MKFVKLQYYFLDKTKELFVNLDQIESLIDNSYEYYGNQYRYPYQQANWDATFSDPNAIVLCLKSGREYALTELSGQLLKRLLPMENLI